MTTRLIEAPVYRWPTKRSRTWFKGFLDRVVKDANVAAVIVVGSAVRPDVASEDLDLMVLCHDVSALRPNAPMEVDVRKLSISDLESRIGAGHDMLIWAIRLGRPVVDKEGLWAGVVARWASRLPLPSASVCSERARAARQRMEDMRAIGDECAVADLAVAYETYRARARLLQAGVFPASRPELAGQLREIGEIGLAGDLEKAISARKAAFGGSKTAA